MLNRNGPPIPSLPALCFTLLEYISNHPLIVKPPVFHPLSNEVVYIDRYRLYNGIELNPGLTCSIFPHYLDSDTLPEPTSLNVSSLYKPENIGPNSYDKAIYHIGVRFNYASSTIGNKVSAYANKDSTTHPDQILLTELGTKEIDLYINVGTIIIGYYLEVLRLVIEDEAYKPSFQNLMRVGSLELLYTNLKSSPWEKDTNVYFQEGEALIRLDGFISRGWRDKFLQLVTDININTQETITQSTIVGDLDQSC